MRAPWGSDCDEGKNDGSQMVLERPPAERERRVGEAVMKPGRIQSSTGHVEPCVNERRPLRKAKYYSVTDSVKYREGKVKRTPGGE